jgi:hypothetical protein
MAALGIGKDETSAFVEAPDGEVLQRRKRALAHARRENVVSAAERSAVDQRDRAADFSTDLAQPPRAGEAPLPARARAMIIAVFMSLRLSSGNVTRATRRAK